MIKIKHLIQSSLNKIQHRTLINIIKDYKNWGDSSKEHMFTLAIWLERSAKHK